VKKRRMGGGCKNLLNGMRARASPGAWNGGSFVAGGWKVRQADDTGGERGKTQEPGCRSAQDQYNTHGAPAR